MQKKATTNGEGVYTFAGLTPGKYSNFRRTRPASRCLTTKEVEIKQCAAVGRISL